MKIFGYEPAAIMYAINAGVALLVSFGIGLTHDQVGAITTIATVILTVATAVMTRPIVVSTITAAVGSLLTAAAAFGLHLTADQIGATVTVLSIVWRCCCGRTSRQLRWRPVADRRLLCRLLPPSGGGASTREEAPRESHVHG